MKIGKIRGHKRRWKTIDEWVEKSRKLNLDYLKKHQRDYAKIRVHPWSGISLTNSQIPEPNGRTKSKIIRGLIEIYDSWKKDLDQLDEAYYLKIWLFEPRFSRSQVVCAIGDHLSFYKNTLYQPEVSSDINLLNYHQLKNEMIKFNWGCFLDEDHFDNSEPGEAASYSSHEAYLKSKKWFENRLKNPHRTTQFKEPIGDATAYYSFQKGMVWIGEKQSN